MMDKISSSLIILSMSLFNSRFDISNLLSTKKKPCCECNRAYFFSDRQKLALERDGKIKPPELISEG
jgi:hypothetical protein